MGLFNIFINGLDYGTERTLKKIVGDIKLGEILSTLEDTIRTQDDFVKVQKCSEVKKMKFNKDK